MTSQLNLSPFSDDIWWPFPLKRCTKYVTTSEQSPLTTSDINRQARLTRQNHAKTNEFVPLLKTFDSEIHVRVINNIDTTRSKSQPLVDWLVDIPLKKSHNFYKVRNQTKAEETIFVHICILLHHWTCRDRVAGMNEWVSHVASEMCENFSLCRFHESLQQHIN